MRNWTDKQLEAITAEGDLLVSAAAGAGKTAVLTERIARLIANGASVDSLLVVTFTRAAAAEMKERIERRLHELASAEADADAANRLFAAAASAERANISTIHSFCSRVLRRNYSIAGIDPQFRIADTQEAAVLMEQALDECLEKAFAENETRPSEGFAALLKAVRTDVRLAELIKRLYRYSVSLPDPDAWLDRAVYIYGDGFPGVMDAVAEDIIRSSREEPEIYLSKAAELIRSLSPEQKNIIRALHSDMDRLLALSLQNTYDGWRDALAQFKFDRLTWNRGTPEEDKADVKEYRDGVKKLISEYRERRFAHSMEEERLLAQRLAPPIGVLRRLVGSFGEIYSAIKTGRGLIDFSDVEQLALKVLRNESCASEYRCRFKHVFIDEYQDVNPVQEAILAAVSGGSCFMVGDVKQSIYRFRMAEPGIFLEKYRTYRGADGKRRIDLNRNFRSSSAILDAANALFEKLMHDSVGEIDYSDNAALVSGLGDVGPVHPCELVLINVPTQAESPEDDADEPDRVSAEAGYAARRILDMMQNEQLTENGVSRPYRWSDFTVLLRSTKALASKWMSVFSDAGIPCISDAASGFFDAVEVRVFLDLLRVIDNRRQDIPLLAVMRSPIFGFTDEELIHIRSDYGGADWLDRVTCAALDAASPTWGVKSRRMLDSLARWRKRCRLVGVGDFVGALLDETRFGVYCSALSGGAARSANLEALCAKARRYSDMGRGGLHGFITYMDGVTGAADAEPIQSPQVDAVQIMSVHKSKGLEFPVVFLGGTLRSFNRSYTRDVGLFDAELGIGLCSVDGNAKSKHILQRAIAQREARRMCAEEMRVLYVAMTRARSRLVITGAAHDVESIIKDGAKPLNDMRIMRSKSFMEWMLGAYFPNGLTGMSAKRSFPNGGELSLSVLSAEEAVHGARRMSRDRWEEWACNATFADTSEVDLRFASAYPHDADTRLPSKLSVTGLAGRSTEIAELPNFMQVQAAPDGVQIGTLTHRLLQRISIAPHTADSVRSELAELTAAGLFSPAEAAVIRTSSVAAFFASNLGMRLIASPRVEREKEFNIMLGADELIQAPTSSEVMLQGIIDCCFIENGRWVLIDHKTTRVEAPHTARSVARQYQSQIDLYSKALEKLTGIPVAERYIYMLSVDEAVRM